MQITQRTMLCKSFFAMVLLFAVYGCQTTNNKVTPEQPVSTVKSEPVQVDVENAENTAAGLSQTTPAEKEVEGTVAAEKTSDSEKERMENFHKRFGSFLGGHGVGSMNVPAVAKESAEDATVTPDAVEDRPFVMLEKKLYGRWINIKETESYDFHDDGTVTIVVIDKRRDRSQKLDGLYKLVEEGRIKIGFKEGPFANAMPARHFKISISENEFALTDEPKGPDGPDGPTTMYKRVE